MRAINGYQVDENPSRLDVESIWAFLSSEAYWSKWRNRADFDKQLASAWRVVGCYDVDGAQVGFARAVSDGVCFAYLADVYIVTAHRGIGLGAALLREMIEDGPGARFRWMLHTQDAHGLYARFGFEAAGAKVMERRTDRG